MLGLLKPVFQLTKKLTYEDQNRYDQADYFKNLRILLILQNEAYASSEALQNPSDATTLRETRGTLVLGALAPSRNSIGATNKAANYSDHLQGTYSHD